MGKSIPRALESLRKRARLSLDELARRGGFRRASSIQRYLADSFDKQFLKPDTARRFARALAGLGDPPITQSEVMALAGPEFAAQPTRHVPEVDFIEAGGWAEVVDPYPAGLGVRSIPVTSEVGPRAFALRIRGRSMEQTYFEGDVIVIDPDVQPVPGDDVVAKLSSETEATFKRYRVRTPKEVELLPLNDLHPTLTLSPRNPGRIVGVMVEHHRYRRR